LFNKFKSIGNGTFGGAAAEKPLNRLTKKCGIGDYVGDATQYPKCHVNLFRGLAPRKGGMLMVCFLFVL